MLQYFHEYIMPLFHLGLEMSERGVCVDKELLERYKTLLTRGIEKKRARFEELTKRNILVPSKRHVNKKKKNETEEEFLERKQSAEAPIPMVKGVNPASPKQVMDWLYEELKLPKQYNMVEGEKKLTSNDEAIEKLAKKYGKTYPALRLLRWERMAEKMLNTYAEVVLGDDGRVHTLYGFTETGRFTSKKTD